VSSANLVRLAVIPETAYGVTPGSGNFKTARFTSESLSGTPDTVESQQIRTDRQSSGQIVTGLQVGGDLNFELAKESALDDFLQSAMLNVWATQGLVTVNLSYDAGTGLLTRASGDWGASNDEGDFMTLAGFVAAKNNVQVMIAEIVSATVARIVGPEGMVTEVGTGTTYKRADKLSIGLTKRSYTIEKSFLDLTEKAIVYRGMMVNTMELNVAFGELVTGRFGFVGNDYETVDDADDFPTDGRTVDAPATSQTFNGSIDMPFLASAAVGTLSGAGLDIQSLGISLNNNKTAQNVIGDIAPRDYSPGTAAIEVTLNAYFKDAAWATLAKKLSQEPFALGFIVKNSGGWYGIYMPAVQVSFDDPSSGGQNQEISLEMTGRAKVGPNGESALYIFRST
jgi:hypothetical protein